MHLQFRENRSGDQFFALRTFRQDGTPVSTPIWLAPANDRWYGYTPVRSWKVQRIAHNSNVQVAASDFDGEPRSDWRAGRARILPRSELSAARRALLAKYRTKFLLFMFATLLGRPRRRGGRAVGLEIALDHGC